MYFTSYPLGASGIILELVLENLYIFLKGIYKDVPQVLDNFGQLKVL